MAEPREIADGELVTQFGSKEMTPEQPFRNRPRAKDEDGISVILGKLSVGEAAKIVCGHSGAAGAGVRYSTAGNLRSAGFTVTHTPNRRNPGHTSVQSGHPWDDETVTRFDGSFGGPVWGEDVEDDE